MGEVRGTAEVAPVVFVGAEGEDFLSLSSKAKVGVDDRKGAFLGEHREKARGNDVDAGESGEGPLDASGKPLDLRLRSG